MYTITIEAFKNTSGKKYHEWTVLHDKPLFLDKDTVLELAKEQFTYPEGYIYLQTLENDAKQLMV